MLSAEPVIDNRDLTPDVALDALSHDGRGPSSWLEQVALQVEPSQLFADRFVRALDVLGHLEIERDSRTLAMASWEVLPPMLVGLHREGFALVGLRGRRLEKALNETACDLGVRVERVAQGPAAPDRIVIQTDAASAAHLARTVGKVAEAEIEVIADAGRGLAAALPSLQAVIESLARQPMVGARSIKRWSIDLARWRSVGDASAPGAYQLLSPVPLYCLRDAKDIANGTMQRVDPRVAKYGAALKQRDPLVGYDSDSESLYVPLGADLPGLYGRAAVLCSGQVPFEDEAQRVTRYPSVPQDVAEHLAALLQPEVA